MRKIILTVIFATLLLANTIEETKTQEKVVALKDEVKSITKVAKTETGAKFEIKTSERETMLETALAVKEAEREEKAKMREAKLQKLDSDLAVKAKERSTRVY